MSTTFTALIQALFQPTMTTDIGTLKPQVSFAKNITFGSGVGQGNLLVVLSRTVASSASPDSVDLSGSLVMPDGGAAIFGSVVALAVRNLSTTAGEILDVGSGSNAFASWIVGTSARMPVGPDGVFLTCNPAAAAFTVTPGTGDILQVATRAGTGVQYLLGVLGRA